MKQVNINNTLSYPLKNFKKIGLALGGGGGRGAYHLGIFKALHENGLVNKISVLSGASVGALNAILLLQNNLDRITHLWLAQVEKILHQQHYLKELINQNLLPNTTNQNLWVSCSKLNLKPNYFNLTTTPTKEEKIKILLASTAIPFVFKNVKIDNCNYFDGSFSDNLPIKPLYNDGCDLIITAPLWRLDRINPKKYPRCQFIELVPKTSLGGLAGIFNFKPTSVQYLMKQGYDEQIDLIRTLPQLIGSTPSNNKN